MNKKRILTNILFPFLALIAIIGIWYLVAWLKNNSLVLPYPEEVLARFFSLWKEKNFLSSILGTLGRTTLCFVISFILAIILALLAEIAPWTKSFFAPVISLLRSAPTVAVILLLYAFLPAKKMSVIVGFLIGFPVLYSAFCGALSSVDKKLITMSKVYEISAFRRAINVYLPSILPATFDASRSTLSLILKVVIASEILTLVPLSLGGKIQTAYASFEIEYLLAWTLLAIVLSYALELIVTVLKFIIVRWTK